MKKNRLIKTIAFTSYLCIQGDDSILLMIFNLELRAVVINERMN